VRRAARTDANQPEIVAALRAAGCSVQHLHTIGGGCPDILVGRAGKNYILEIKDGAKAPSGRQLTEDEKEWHRTWRGVVHTVCNIAEALDAVGLRGWHA